MKRRTEWRLPDRGYRAPMRCLATAEGYAMVRYKGAAVHVIRAEIWDKFPLCDINGNLITGEARTNG